MRPAAGNALGFSLLGITLPLFSLPTANTAINVTHANTHAYAPVHTQAPGQQAG